MGQDEPNIIILIISTVLLIIYSALFYVVPDFFDDEESSRITGLRISFVLSSFFAIISLILGEEWAIIVSVVLVFIMFLVAFGDVVAQTR